MTGLRLGSLFSGYLGLDLGVQSVLGGTTAWASDIDAGPSKLLAYRYPEIPNLGDITAVDWAAVEPVDVITGGSPCQDVSHAGKRAGMRPGTRSGLWASMCDAIDIIRPRLVVWENVRGALSAEADSNVEPCDFCVGDGDGVALRALGRVVGDLHELGYVGSWRLVRASDAGAPHARARVFVTAWPVDADADGGGRRAGVADDDPRGGEPNAQGRRALPAAGTDADAAHDGRERGGLPRQRGTGPADRRLPPADAGGAGHGALSGGTGGAHGGATRTAYSGGLPRRRGSAPADARGDGRERDAELDGAPAAGSGVRGGRHADGRDVEAGGLDWGAYAPAIHRWESVLGRPAPAPTEPGAKGQPRLSPAFTEWLMGLPAGHVTAVPGLTRNEQLKLLGNGVVPQQAALALRQMGF